MPQATPEPDPFGTAELRAATLAAWAASPTRRAEDAAAERELTDIGYRDRLLTELAANAADAATIAGIDGTLAISVDGDTLRFANTGAPLSREGVASLTALRVSPKSHADGQRATVGHFGVGFRATAFAPVVQIASTTGSIEFNRFRSCEAAGSQDVPAQRLAWPSDAVVPAGYDTEVSVQVGAQVQEFVDAAYEQVPDLLLELPALARVLVAGTDFTRERDGDHLVIARDGTVVRRWLTASAVPGTTWLVPVIDGHVMPLADDVLRAPTPTTVELSLPARVVTDLPLTPDRRGVHPDADIAGAAAGYSILVALAPDDEKHLLLPQPALTRGQVDGLLREQIEADLRVAEWVPTVSGWAIAPERAWVISGLTETLAAVLADVMAPLAHPDVSDRRTTAALVRLGARELGLADLADVLASVTGEPTWWRSVYSALGERVHGSDDAAELGTLPVPRADGRIHIGARGLAVLDDALDTDQLIAPSWVPLVHPDAYDPLLDRMGLQHRGAADLLDDPALATELEHADDHGDLADVVLRLIAAAELTTTPAVLGQLELLGEDGEVWPADELLLPAAPLRSVLDADSPFGTVAAEVVDRYGEESLRALGVGWGFSVVHEDLPTGPDHDLPDEADWWDEFEVPPNRLDAVRDLDLVDPAQWHRALVMLASDDETKALLADGYTRWWLRRYAEIDGVALRHLRASDDVRFNGLFAVYPGAVSAELASLLVGERPDDADDAQAWLDALGDRGRTIAPGVAARAYAAIVAAVRGGAVRVDDLDTPMGVRTLAGSVTTTSIVLDQPWLVPLVPADRAVLPGPAVSPDAAATLAEVIDADVATDVVRAVPVSDGRPASADDHHVLARAAELGRVVHGTVMLHDELTVAVRLDGVETQVRLDYFEDESGVVHLSC